MISHHRLLTTLFFVATLPHAGRAQQAIATITGTVYTGTDGMSGKGSSVFGFAPGTSLAGQTFTLNFSFDGSKGQQTVTKCCAEPPVPAKSDIAGSGDESPGTAVLQIGNDAFAFGSSTFGNSETWLSGPPIGSSAYYDVAVQDDANDNKVYAYVYPADGKILASGVSWSSAISGAKISGVSGFWISVKTDKGYKSAWGELNIEDITVSGPLACPAGSFTPPAAPGGVPHHNVTLPGHRFYPGQVTRSVIIEDGEIYIQTIGTGTGAWPWVNQNAADIYWGTADALIRSLFTPTF
jgi:hypothetical protein